MLDEVFRDLQTVCISGRFQEEFLSLAGSWVSGLKLKKKIETRSHFRQSVPEMASARDLGMKEPTWSKKMRSVLFLHGSFSLNSSGGRDWYFQRAEEEMES